MWRLYLIGMGAIISAILAVLKLSGAIYTDWLVWVSIPLIVSVVIAFLGSILDEGIDFFT